MRRARIKLAGEGFYHVMSRIVRREFWIDDEEKRHLLDEIRRAAAFSGVELYTYALMDNHFHLLVRVPAKRDVDDNELRRRMTTLYGQKRTNALFTAWSTWEQQGLSVRAEAAKTRLKARMHDLSHFCKTFKERYTQAYNRRHGNAGAGTIWGGRFQSVLLEGSSNVLMTVAAYIHLNPVRAGIVSSSAQSLWTGFGSACRGDSLARSGLVALAERLFGPCSWEDAQKVFSNAIEGRICARAARPPLPSESSSAFPAANPEQLKMVLQKRCLAFSRAGILGSSAFLGSHQGILPPETRRVSPPTPVGLRALGLASPFAVRQSA